MTLREPKNKNGTADERRQTWLRSNANRVQIHTARALMANHLAKLICQFNDWKGCVVKNNVKVGRLPHGGWVGELDVVVYKPNSQEVIHYELSLDYRRFHSVFLCVLRVLCGSLIRLLPACVRRCASSV